LTCTAREARCCCRTRGISGAPSVGELAGVGVSRVSVGGAFAFAALGALAEAATELRDRGTYGYLAGSAAGRQAIQRAV
jgi:2-methylisocitrate lyase-like PEP mutase family enzyme